MQKTTKLISKIIATAIVFLALAPQDKQIAQEEEVIRLFLLDTKCVNTGIGNWDNHSQDVSVGRAVYTSRLYMGAGDSFASMTCKIQPDDLELDYQTLQLAFGMRDNDRDSPEVEVNVYLDGQKAPDHSWTVYPGKGVSVLIPIFNIENISLETVCRKTSRRYCDSRLFLGSFIRNTYTT